VAAEATLQLKKLGENDYIAVSAVKDEVIDAASTTEDERNVRKCFPPTASAAEHSQPKDGHRCGWYSGAAVRG